MNSKKEWIRKIKFTLFSISAGVIEIGLFTILNTFTKLPYWVCYLTALVASVVWNFTLNREFTFKASNNVVKAMLLVGLFYLVFTPVSTILGDKLVNHGWNEYLVTGINMLFNFVLEYLYDKYFVFKGTIDAKEKR